MPHDDELVRFHRVSYKPTTSCLVVFVKAPRLGTVKTRLAAGLGPDGAGKALAVHRRLVERTIAAVRELRAAPAPSAHVEVAVAVTPADAVDEVREWLGKDLRFVPQSGADLGERMSDAIASRLREGVGRVALIGTDAPRIRSGLIRVGLSRLWEADVVLGPTSDGGYWFVAAKDEVPPIFEGVEWSTPTVLSRTIELAEAAGLTVARIETLDDIDTADDLARYPDLLG